MVGYFDSASDFRPVYETKFRTFQQAFASSWSNRFILLEKEGIYIVADTWYYITTHQNEDLRMAAWSVYRDRDIAIVTTVLRGAQLRQNYETIYMRG